jgi:hypothetical protein
LLYADLQLKKTNLHVFLVLHLESLDHICNTKEELNEANNPNPEQISTFQPSKW